MSPSLATTLQLSTVLRVLSMGSKELWQLLRLAGSIPRERNRRRCRWGSQQAGMKLAGGRSIVERMTAPRAIAVLRAPKIHASGIPSGFETALTRGLDGGHRNLRRGNDEHCTR